MQVKKCPDCGHYNLIKHNSCEVCKRDITFQQFEIIDDESIDNDTDKANMDEKYVRCRDCGTIIPIKNVGDMVRCTEVTCQKKFRIMGEDWIITKEQLENIDYGTSNSSDDIKIKSVILINSLDQKKIEIPLGHYVIGAKGDFEHTYFATLKYVSSKHIYIDVLDDAVYVTDISKNHTYFNSRYIDNRFPYNEKQEIHDGDILVLADQPFEVKICR